MVRFTWYCQEQQQQMYFISVVGLFLSTLIAVLFVASSEIRTSAFLLFVTFAFGVPLGYQLVLSATHDPINDVPTCARAFRSRRAAMLSH